MDIRCPSCSTLYEFDATRIGPKGVNVRCSACGQVFRVTNVEPETGDQWMIRRESTGEVVQFADLSTLQRWIIEQKVSRRDKISKTGDAWRSLGSIQELTAFFKVVDELNDPKSASRDTDGYLTAENRAASVREEAPTGPTAAVGHRGFTPTPASLPAALSTLGGTRLMASVVDVTEERPVSASHYAVPAPLEATIPIAVKDVVTPLRRTGQQAREQLPEVRPAAASAPVHAADVPTEETVRQREVTADPAPARRVTRTDDFELGAAPADGDYSLGDSPWPEPAAAIAFAAPALDTGRTSDYTSDYASLQREQRSRWPLVLLFLLLVTAGILILLAAFRPSAIGLGRDADTPVAGADAGQRLTIVTNNTYTGDTGPDAPVAVVPPAGSGSEPDGSGAEVPAEADAGAEDAGSAAPPGPDAAVEPADAGTPTPAPAPDAGASAPAPSNTVAAADTRPSPTPTRDAGAATATRPDAGRATEPAPSPSRGYDDLMSQGNAALEAGRNQDALNLFSAATDSRPNSAEAHVGVARAYEAMGRSDLAAVRYERATNVNSRYTPAWLGLGDARRRSGDVGGACEAYQRVVSIVRTGRAAERAQQAIAELCN